MLQRVNCDAISQFSSVWKWLECRKVCKHGLNGSQLYAFMCTFNVQFSIKKKEVIHSGKCCALKGKKSFNFDVVCER